MTATDLREPQLDTASRESGPLARLRREPLVMVVVAGLFALLSYFIVYPVGSMLIESLWAERTLDLSRYEHFVRSRYLRQTFYNTVLISVFATMGAIVVGAAFALLVTRTDVRGKPFFLGISILPLITPPFFAAFAFVLLLGRNGLVNRTLRHLFDWSFEIYGWHGVIFAQTLALFPIAFLTITAALSSMDVRLEEAAEDLGSRYTTVLRKITLPLLAPAILGASVLIFMFNMSAFGVPTILGANRLFYRDASMLAPEMIMQILGRFNWAMGATLATVILIPTAILFLAQTLYLRRRSYVTVTGMPSAFPSRPIPTWLRRSLLGFCVAVSIVIFAVYAVIVMGAFTRTWGVDWSPTLRHLQLMMDTSSDSIRNSVVLSLAGAIVGTAIGTVIAYVVTRWRFPGRGSLNVLAIVPFALPGVVVGLGLALAFGAGHLVLVGTGTIIAINYAVRRMPFAIEAGKAGLSQIDESLEYAAADLGAGPLGVFRSVTLPLLKPTIVASLAFTFILAMTDITAVIFLVSPRWGVMSVDIYYYVLAGRFGVAAGMATLLILIVGGVLALVWKFSGLGQRMLRL